MKKLLALTAVLAFCLSAVACGSSTDNNTNSDTIDSASYRVGVGSYTTTDDSSPSVEGENGKGVVSTTYATVIFDNNDIIRKVYIDEVQSKIYFDGNGQLVNRDAYNDIRSKRELGDEYNMKPASDIGKEWYEQINSLESWLVGKNIKEISDSVMNMGPYGTEDDYANNTSDSAENNAENNTDNAAKNIADDARGIVDGVVDGARNILGRNGENSNTDTDSTNTAEGITNSTDNTDDNNSGNITGDTQTDSTPPAPDREDMNDMAEDYLDWEEDLKSSVTIDLTNIQRALQKAYANAR
ncbi:MAG: hypothetical protein E7483_06725 [Ruminococcaceae bacterium]|nr:hypothetical protein [Oscillospiraceae bacterium]